MVKADFLTMIGKSGEFIASSNRNAETRNLQKHKLTEKKWAKVKQQIKLAKDKSQMKKRLLRNRFQL